MENLEPIRVFAGQTFTLSSVGPWPEVIITQPRHFTDCYVGACPYLNDEPAMTPEEEAWWEANSVEVRWEPGVGFVSVPKGKK